MSKRITKKGNLFPIELKKIEPLSMTDEYLATYRVKKIDVLSRFGLETCKPMVKMYTSLYVRNLDRIEIRVIFFIKANLVNTCKLFLVAE